MKAHWIQTTSISPWKQRYRMDRRAAIPNLTVGEPEGVVWEGFGGCFNELGWRALSWLGDEDRRVVLDTLFNPKEGCRFSFCRLPIGASDFACDWYSHNETAEDFEQHNFSIVRDHQALIPYVKEALRREPAMRLFASPWSPPVWMKRPAVYNYGRLRMEKAVLDSYALYLARFVQDYSLQGIRIEQVHVQNEPVANQKFPSCVWTPEDMRVFLRDHLAAVFARERVEAEIWLGTLNTDDYDGWIAPVLHDDGVRRVLGGVGLQWAGRQALSKVREGFPDLRVMQTENECGDGLNTWAYARHVFNLYQDYLRHGVSAYVYWNMVLPAGGESTWGWKQNALFTVDRESGSFERTHEFHIVRHFAEYIRPGAQRLQLRGRWAPHAVAYRNGDGSTVLVLSNPLKEAADLHLALGENGVSARLEPDSYHTFILG